VALEDAGDWRDKEEPFVYGFDEDIMVVHEQIDPFVGVEIYRTSIFWGT
jgi:hypothetical protein